MQGKGNTIPRVLAVTEFDPDYHCDTVYSRYLQDTTMPVNVKLFEDKDFSFKVKWGQILSWLLPTGPREPIYTPN
jgi:hypothetical protein